MEEEIKKLIKSLEAQQPLGRHWLSSYEEGCYDVREEIIDKLEEIIRKG